MCEDELLQFIIPAKYKPGTDKMSKKMLKDERIIDFIVKTVGKLTPLLSKSNGRYKIPLTSHSSDA
ncbi:hypothetical protein BD770DRAFT_465430 [Pilaira anomala]|nr:hypothetical protein BD770DRAFT_465430 [Pilaira anomala]